MKLPILAALLLLAASALAQAAKPRSKVNPARAGKILAEQDQDQAVPGRKLIEFYERELLEADKKGNWEAIARRLADDFLEVAGDGRYYSKDQIAKLFPESKVSSYRMSEVEFRSLGAKGAILAYRLDVQATFRGMPLPPAFRVSTVWGKRDSAWKAVFHQGTLIPAGSEPKH